MGQRRRAVGPAVSEELRSGVHVFLVGNSVVIRLEDGQSDPDDELLRITLTPAKALKLSGVLVQYAWRAAAHARRTARSERETNGMP